MLRHALSLIQPTPAAPTELDERKTGLGFADAVRIARGCHDYNGGYRDDPEHGVFHHGIQTVINSLEAAEKNGLKDTQVAALHRMGDAARASGGEGR